ncbi:MAG TPA: transcription termination factor NusA [Phycisphaerae bacterium]|nr:transcription termination factor NusA [Phycisphaerae bacterium]
MNQELLRIVDGLARDKNIDRETVLEDLEAAMLSAIRKANTETEDILVHIDRETGDITAKVDGKIMSVRDLGRIAAQTAKQVMIQRIREAERGSIYEEYLERKGQIVTGRTARWEGGALVVDLGRTEAILPKGEQIPGESHMPEERIRALVLDVREQPSQIKIILSRTHPDFIRALFDLEVPEVAEKIIEIKVLAREAGYRTKAAVNSLDPKVDAVGACVGIRGSRIKNIVDELGGEKIDIVRWNDSSKILIANALKPAEVAEVALCFELGRATVVVVEDQLSLAIGKRGQNVRLAARLTGWDIDILTPNEYNAGLDLLEKSLREVEGVDTTTVDKIIAMGMVNVLDVEEVGPEPLINELELEREAAQRIVIRCAESAKEAAERQTAEAERQKLAREAETQAAEAARARAVEASKEPAAEPPAAEAAEATSDAPPETAAEPPAAEAAEVTSDATPEAAAEPPAAEAAEAPSDAPPEAAAESVPAEQAPAAEPPADPQRDDEAPHAGDPTAPTS